MSDDEIDLSKIGNYNLDFLKDMGSTKDRTVKRSKRINGLIVSTVWTSDEGYETALIDHSEEEVHPVERYPDREAAIKGHEKWVKFAQGDEVSVTKLGGWGGLVRDKKIKLQRVPSSESDQG